MPDGKPSTRIEKDSLGRKEIPGHVYYGIQTARAVENYPISGLRAHRTLIRAIAMVKEAAALANRELGLIDEKTADAIVEAAREIQQGKWDDHFVVDVFQAGAGVSFHMNSNEVIANRASELLGGARGEYKHVHPNDHVNYGQSTNDVFPTAMRLSALLELDKLYPVLESLTAALDDKGREFHHILKSGRTHMQDAVPLRLGQEFTAYAGAIRRAKTLSMSFTYNGELNDAVFAPLPPPADGFTFFQGPTVPGNSSDSAIFIEPPFKFSYLSGKRGRPMTAPYFFINGSANFGDPPQGAPTGSTQFYRFFNGEYGLSGNEFQDPAPGILQDLLIRGKIL